MMAHTGGGSEWRKKDEGIRNWSLSLAFAHQQGRSAECSHSLEFHRDCNAKVTGGFTK